MQETKKTFMVHPIAQTIFAVASAHELHYPFNEKSVLLSLSNHKHF
jgi:hypothetical protein